MQAARQKLVSIIVPALKRPDLTRRCIDSLLRQSIPAWEYEIIVVENEARPETVLPDFLSQNVRRIELAENYGTTGSINRGVADSSSEYVLLLNNDVELDLQFLATLTSVLNNAQEYGFATGKLISAAGNRDRLDGAGDALLRGGGAFRLGHCDLDVGQFDHSRRVLAGCGAATLFRRSVFDEVHGLDEDFFAYLDDVDLALRAQLIGHQGIYIPSALAYHIGSATLGHVFHPKIVEWMTRNQILLVVKNYPSGVLLKLLPQVIGFQILWLGIVLRRCRFISYISGLIGAMRALPRSLRKRALLKYRRITDTEFLGLLETSEEQILEWENTRTIESRSGLLKAYFTLFGKS
jgi:GT2 family glycosyltransferase